MYRTNTEMKSEMQKRNSTAGTTAKSKFILDLQEQSESARREFSDRYRKLLIDRGYVNEKISLRNFIQVQKANSAVTSAAVSVRPTSTCLDNEQSSVNETGTL